ncbi:MAG: EamA family transporter [Pseudomonadota bacterium]
MSSLAVFIWIINVVCDTIGHIALKYAAILEHETELGRWKAMLSSLPLWIGIVCFCLEFVVWLAFLSVLSLSQGVLLGAINMVAIVIAGKLIFKERLDRMRVIGVGLITIGVALVGIFA